jgi:hypothetical protein
MLDAGYCLPAGRQAGILDKKGFFSFISSISTIKALLGNPLA